METMERKNYGRHEHIGCILAVACGSYPVVAK